MHKVERRPSYTKAKDRLALCSCSLWPKLENHRLPSLLAPQLGYFEAQHSGGLVLIDAFIFFLSAAADFFGF